jgi:hypothetical protein
MRILLGLIALAISLVAVADNHQRPMTSSEAVKVAIQALGHKATEHLDIQSEPHLVLTSDVDGAEEIAVFFDDCDSFGICEDITYYANFGSVSVSNARLNAWNHINSKNRTKAFRSDDGSVGVSYTISFLSPERFNANGMLAGLFLLEAEIFGVMLGLEEEN